jgi:hypothetical protein
MNRQPGTWATIVLTMTCAAARGGEPAPWQSARTHICQPFRPIGGWNPGGGLFHWWDPYCMPRCVGPDDYCRKPFPVVCRRGDPPTVIPAGPRQRSSLWWLPGGGAPVKSDP